jgi:hypothetical protein
MWYFPGWSAGSMHWQELARVPWRMPLLYDTRNPQTRVNGIVYYDGADPRVMDWHVKWMAEHSVTWMLFDWYPRTTAEGKLDPTQPLNGALETGFLGKPQSGGAPVATNRFEKVMQFVVMWTNHGEFEKIPSNIGDYFARQYFKQPNYFKIDGKPLVAIWSTESLIKSAGGVEGARAQIQALRDAARREGIPEIYVAAIFNTSPVPSRPAADRIRSKFGMDGAVGYWSAGSKPQEQTVTHASLGGVDTTIRWEDFPKQTVPGLEKGWEDARNMLGRDYLVSTTPMQDWRGLTRPTLYVMMHVSPRAYEEMLMRARRHIESHGLRKIITIEAWNEWVEGSYMEPSIEYGYQWLEAIHKVFPAK